jgi:hypothetical protein
MKDGKTRLSKQGLSMMITENKQQKGAEKERG